MTARQEETCLIAAFFRQRLNLFIGKFFKPHSQTMQGLRWCRFFSAFFCPQQRNSWIYFSTSKDSWTVEMDGLNLLYERCTVSFFKKSCVDTDENVKIERLITNESIQFTNLPYHFNRHPTWAIKMSKLNFFPSFASTLHLPHFQISK